MSRPPDVTKLSEAEAATVRGLLRAGKKQYGLTWSGIGDRVGYSEKSVRNYLLVNRPLPRRIAKALVRGIVYSPNARRWRIEHGCSEHRTRAAFLCMKRPPCDPWIDSCINWMLTARALSDAPIPVLIAPEAIDSLATGLARDICRLDGIGRGKRDAVEKNIRSFLGRNGERFASDFVRTIANRMLKGFAEIDDPRLSQVPADALMFLKGARLYWPNATILSEGTPVARRLEPDEQDD